MPGSGWVTAGRLCLGTQVTPRAGPTAVEAGIAGVGAKVTRVTVVSVAPCAAKVGSTTLVYNFEVERTHTYFVGKANGGEWVHNTCNWRIHGVAPDWAVKGAHITVDGIELAVRPGMGGAINFSPVFSGGNDAANQAAIRAANQLLGDSRFTSALLERVQAAKAYVLQFPNDGGTGRSAELHFLEAALKRLMGQ